MNAYRQRGRSGEKSSVHHGKSPGNLGLGSPEPALTVSFLKEESLQRILKCEEGVWSWELIAEGWSDKTGGATDRLTKQHWHPRAMTCSRWLSDDFLIDSENKLIFHRKVGPALHSFHLRWHLISAYRWPAWAAVGQVCCLGNMSEGGQQTWKGQFNEKDRWNSLYFSTSYQR